jgi:hypothetical protein
METRLRRLISPAAPLAVARRILAIGPNFHPTGLGRFKQGAGWSLGKRVKIMRWAGPEAAA